MSVRAAVSAAHFVLAEYAQRKDPHGKPETFDPGFGALGRMVKLRWGDVLSPELQRKREQSLRAVLEFRVLDSADSDGLKPVRGKVALHTLTQLRSKQPGRAPAQHMAQTRTGQSFPRQIDDPFCDEFFQQHIGCLLGVDSRIGCRVGRDMGLARKVGVLAVFGPGGHGQWLDGNAFWLRRGAPGRQQGKREDETTGR